MVNVFPVPVCCKQVSTALNQATKASHLSVGKDGAVVSTKDILYNLMAHDPIHLLLRGVLGKDMVKVKLAVLIVVAGEMHSAVLHLCAVHKLSHVRTRILCHRRANSDNNYHHMRNAGEGREEESTFDTIVSFLSSCLGVGNV